MFRESDISATSTLASGVGAQADKPIFFSTDSRAAGPRDQVAAMLGAADVLRTRPGHKTARDILADHGEELSALLHPARRPDWPWFEIVYGDDACRLPEALIRGGNALRNTQFVSLGLRTLEWMLSDAAVRTCATALAEACEAAFEVTGEPRWLSLGRTAAGAPGTSTRKLSSPPANGSGADDKGVGDRGH